MQPDRWKRVVELDQLDLTVISRGIETSTAEILQVSVERSLQPSAAASG